MSVWSFHIERVEEFVILCLNRANKVLGYSKISQGGLSGTVADPKVIFQVALKSNASSIILCHNHPSGNTKPSDNDIQLTKKLKKAGEFLELNVLDHLIITSDAYFSFADESLL
jgi:DNA repair protein RadC